MSKESPLALGDKYLGGMSLHDGQAIDRVLIVHRVVDPPFFSTGRLQLRRLLVAARKDARHVRRRDVNEWTIGIPEIDLEEPNAIAASIRHDRDISAWRLGTASQADVVGDVHVVVTTECLTVHAVNAQYAGTRIEARRRRGNVFVVEQWCRAQHGLHDRLTRGCRHCARRQNKDHHQSFHAPTSYSSWEVQCIDALQQRCVNRCG